MTVKTFAAIHVGSYELSMKIYEVSKKNGMKEIDHIRYRLELGTQTYVNGRVSNERIEELCEVLKEFQTTMVAYRVQEYKAYGTSAIREMKNIPIVLEQIRLKTGFEIAILSNSEQRFLDYKSIASKGEGFNRIIEKGTAIVDIGGNSIQISLFDKDSLVSTQNLYMGVLRMREKILKLSVKPAQIEELVEEMITNQLYTFKKLYLKERNIEHLIVVDDYLSFTLQKASEAVRKTGSITKEAYLEFCQKIRAMSRQEIAQEFGMPEENAVLLLLASILVRRLLLTMEVQILWAPGVTLCDGIAYEYAEENKLIGFAHDFERDILACAQNISKRYMGSKRRGETLEKLALIIFDSIKKMHGLGKRERLLLQISALLHDCGKYISLANVGECSYSIIISTEIIGLSHREREMVANIVKYNRIDFDYFWESDKKTSLGQQENLTIAKLTAILRIATGLDQSHKQKCRNIKAELRDEKLMLTVDTQEDITLEKGLFQGKADFFEEVFSIRPVIRHKKRI